MYIYRVSYCFWRYVFIAYCYYIPSFKFQVQHQFQTHNLILFLTGYTACFVLKATLQINCLNKDLYLLSCIFWCAIKFLSVYVIFLSSIFSIACSLRCKITLRNDKYQVMLYFDYLVVALSKYFWESLSCSSWKVG